MTTEPIPVVAAIIAHNDRILICQRRAGDTFGLKWEFPGGKVHAGETLEAALMRELREELDVEAVIGPLIEEKEFAYSQTGRTVRLSFFRASIPPHAELKNLAFEQFLWATPPELPRYDFLPADRELVERIARGEL